MSPNIVGYTLNQRLDDVFSGSNTSIWGPKSNDIIRKVLDEFCEEFGIKYNTNVKDDNNGNSSHFYVQFKYDQRNCSFDDTTIAGNIARNCRGLILDIKNRCSIVAQPYNKFFNYNESYAAKIDYDSARVLEKLDGTMMIMYFCENTWRVATLGSIDATGDVCSPQNVSFVQTNPSNSMSFNELFWKIWKDSNFPLLTNDFNRIVIPDFYDPKRNAPITVFTLMFELLSNLNEVVVKHNVNELVLHGVRDGYTGMEYPPEYFLRCVLDSIRNYGINTSSFTNIPIVKSFDIKDDILGKAIEEANKHEANELEGFVIVDKNFNRIKIKSDQYIRQHKLRSNFSLADLVELIQKNEGDELINYLPEYYEIFCKYFDKYTKLIQFVQDIYSHYRSTTYNISRDDKINKKDFAISIKEIPVKHYLFSAYDAEDKHCNSEHQKGLKPKERTKFNSNHFIKNFIANDDPKSLLTHLDNLDEYLNKFEWVLLVD